jgi:hypothetical protein
MHAQPLEAPFPTEENYFADTNMLAALDTSVSPVELLSAFSPSSDTVEDYSWADSSPTSSSCSDSDYSPCQVKEEPITAIQDVKPQSSIKKSRKRNQRKETKTTAKGFDGHSSLFFTRAELLKMSCEELEERVTAVERIRSLTEKEKKEIKRQRRMIKNRESAYASRVRKKQLVENMEEAMNKIQAENRELKQRVRDLELENQNLRARVNEPFWKVGPSSTFNPAKIVTQTSTSLFIVLLSFGLLFAQIQPDEANTFPHFSSVFPSFEAQEVLGSGHVIPASIVSGLKAHTFSTNAASVKNPRALLHVSEDVAVVDADAAVDISPSPFMQESLVHTDSFSNSASASDCVSEHSANNSTTVHQQAIHSNQQAEMLSQV